MPKKDDETVVTALSIPGDVRDGIKNYAKTEGISTSALLRLIADDYVSGRLKVVPPKDDPMKIVRTSVWMPRKLWAQFQARTEKDRVPTQLVIRTWLKQNGS